MTELQAFHAWLDETWPLWRQHAGNVRYNDLKAAFIYGWRAGAKQQESSQDDGKQVS